MKALSQVVASGWRGEQDAISEAELASLNGLMGCGVWDKEASWSFVLCDWEGDGPQ